ncbi:adenine nucleotide alpha hydrolases-like superfamily protein isoform X1 [Wolffia australiana]
MAGGVMVAIDESECSLYALQWTVENLRQAASPLIIFTAQPIADLSYIPAATYGSARMFTSMSAPPELVRSLQEHRKKVSLALLDHAKEICTKNGLTDVETMMEVGDAKEAICEAAEKHQVKLLVLGSHGKGALQRAFLGSVSNYCVHHAKCPVLIVKN